MTFFPTHRRIFAIAWLILAVRLCRHEQRRLPQTPNGRFQIGFPARADYRLGRILGSLHLGFRFPSNRSPYLFESSVGVLSHLHKTPARPLPIQRDF